MNTNDHVETIRAALAANATPDTRHAGAAACRQLLAQIEATAPQPAKAPQLNAEAIATVVAALRSVPPDKLLDLAISKLRTALPPGTELAPQQKAPKFRIVPVAHKGS